MYFICIYDSFHIKTGWIRRNIYLLSVDETIFTFVLTTKINNKCNYFTCNFLIHNFQDAYTKARVLIIMAAIHALLQASAADCSSFEQGPVRGGWLTDGSDSDLQYSNYCSDSADHFDSKRFEDCVHVEKLTYSKNSAQVCFPDSKYFDHFDFDYSHSANCYFAGLPKHFDYFGHYSDSDCYCSNHNDVGLVVHKGHLVGDYCCY